jgi:hypothetical protein
MSVLLLRIGFYIRTFYQRWRRLLIHFAGLTGAKNYDRYFPAESVREWWADLLCYLADIFAVPELYETIMGAVKWKIRPLTEKEKALCISLFGNSIDVRLVRVDDRASIGLRKLALAYVSFNTINYRKKIRTAILVHELVHVWQYQQFGSVYISKALKAQKSEEGYDYGGVSRLYQMMLSDKQLTNFNFEQQADIVEDYYKMLKTGEAFDLRSQAYHYFGSQVMET